jgi:hypothetical protein
MTVELWELDAPAQLQYWPAHVHPTGPGSWDKPRIFQTLREAIKAAITDPEPQGNVAWIMTSGGHTLRAADIEALWLELKGQPAGMSPQSI